MLLLFHRYVLACSERMRELEATFPYSYPEMLAARSVVISCCMFGALLLLSVTLHVSAGEDLLRLALCGAVAGYLCDRYLVRNLVSTLLMSLMCLLFCQLVLFLFKCMVSSIGIQGLLPVLAQVGLSLLLCPPVYLAAWAIRKAGA